MPSSEELAKCSGNYEIAGTIIKVEIQADKLIMTLPGQPIYELLEYQTS
jgi:hypothetical protein